MIEPDYGPAFDELSRIADLDGPVHYQEYAGPADGPRIVLAHGLGGSHLNWSRCAPGLAEHARVWTLDLPGFGRTEPAGRSTTVRANAAVLARFVREVAGAPAILVGNSMGGMISILAAAADPDVASGLVLVDPSVPMAGPTSIDPAVGLRFLTAVIPGLGARSIATQRRKLGSRTMALQTLRLCGVDPAALPPELIDRSVAVVDARRDVRGMDQAFITAARSLVALNALPARYWAEMAAIRVPVLLLQGGRDRLVPVVAGRQVARRNPTWRYEEWADAGHVPQLQLPERFVAVVRDWLAAEGAPAVAAAVAPG
jgi:pimeloyl-ACP methyl ester carboxylesterase